MTDSTAQESKASQKDYDVVVVGGTPGGIAAAIAAARQGRSVALVEYHRHLGGMSASGLGKSDIETRAAIGGLFREFTGRVLEYYRDKYGADSRQVTLCQDGYFYEPSVAELIFGQMIAEQPKITVYKGHRLTKAIRNERRVATIQVTNRTSGAALELHGRVFIDATYEGDLAAAAGASFRLGRESRRAFDELHAGVVYQDYNTRAFLAGTTGQGDHRLQAYTYRLCLSTDPANSVRIDSPPPDYDRAKYVGYLDDWKQGRLGPPRTGEGETGKETSVAGTVVRALSIAEVPNGKTDVNMNPRPLAFPFVEENIGYPEADWETRERISTRIRNLTLGLLYFLQNDPEIPAAHRQLANRYHLAKDEFADNGNFPWQLYVREARRIVGPYTLSEQDLIVGPELGRTRIHADSIAAGEFPIDSFPVRKREPGHDVALEGYLLMEKELTKPYQIPYRIMVPERTDGLLVPVAASTTHVAFSTIRMEPTWMALGQAAGNAAHLAIAADVQPASVDVARLQHELIKQGQILTYFKDINPDKPFHAALQFFGTRGFFPTYLADADKPLDRKQAAEWLKLLPNPLPGAEQIDWTLKTPLSQRELQRIFPSIETSDEPVTRGQFCRAMYERVEK